MKASGASQPIKPICYTGVNLNKPDEYKCKKVRGFEVASNHYGKQTMKRAEARALQISERNSNLQGRAGSPLPAAEWHDCGAHRVARPTTLGKKVEY